MTQNLIDMAKNYLTPDVIEKVGNAAGLNPEQTQKAMGAAVPTLLAGVLQNASTEQGSKRIFDTLKQGSFDGSMLNNLSERLSGNVSGLLETGQGLLGKLFGDKTNAVGEVLSRATGADRSSIMKILAMAGPFVMNLLGKVKKEQGLSEGGLREFLMSQKDAILRHAPSGLAGALGLSSLSDLGGVAGQLKEKGGQWLGREGERARSVFQGTRADRDKSPATSKTLWIALAALALLGVFWLMRGRGRETAEAPAPKPAPVSPDTPAIRGEPTGNLVSMALPSGESIQLEQGSTAHRLAEALKTEAGGPQRVEFQELEFEANQNDPTPRSARAIESVADVLKAYPDARVRIRASAQEDNEAAKELALNRAERVKASLVERGLLSERVTIDQTVEATGKPVGSGIELIVGASR